MFKKFCKEKFFIICVYVSDSDESGQGSERRPMTVYRDSSNRSEK